MTSHGTPDSSSQTRHARRRAASGVSGDSSGGLGSLTGLAIGGEGTDDATREKRREIEDAYKRATKSQPTQAAVNDPWANMRGADEQKPAAKPAPKTAQKKKPAQ